MFGSLKRAVKFILAICIYYSGLLALLSVLKRIRADKNNFTILIYHRILDENDSERDHIQAGIIVSRKIFEKQMAYLSKEYNLLSLKELAEILEKNQYPPSKSIVITFDDGWRDNYLCAYPVLKKHNVPATIFLATDFIDSDNMFWFAEIGMILAKRKIPPEKLWEILEKARKESKNISTPQSSDSHKPAADSIDSDKFIEGLKQFDHQIITRIIAELWKEGGVSSERTAVDRQTLSSDEVLEMSENGIDFGSHGCSHRILTGLDRDEVKRELIESKRILEEKTGKTISLFSYPNGDFNEEIKKLVREAGYDCAITTGGREIDKGALDLFALKRIGIHDGATAGPTGRYSEAIFACLLEKIL
ncbi:MAG: polysaccharide deacetylase family protein [Candidatus Zixiibacteriota bacterium]|nr:MAG: polysaccharide deacetylase family protein [candidate division Zixibacteria bacterium]